jgi:hypothetical protein
VTRYTCLLCHTVFEPPDGAAGARLPCPQCEQPLMMPPGVVPKGADAAGAGERLIPRVARGTTRLAALVLAAASVPLLPRALADRRAGNALALGLMSPALYLLPWCGCLEALAAVSRFL